MIALHNADYPKKATVPLPTWQGHPSRDAHQRRASQPLQFSQMQLQRLQICERLVQFLGRSRHPSRVRSWRRGIGRNCEVST